MYVLGHWKFSNNSLHSYFTFVKNSCIWTNLWDYRLCIPHVSAVENAVVVNLRFSSVYHFNNLTGKFIALIPHTVGHGKRYQSNRLSLYAIWSMLLGELLPDCYIVTNISMLRLGKTKLSVCVCESVPCVHVHMATLVWDIFLVRCRVDMITLR